MPTIAHPIMPITMLAQKTRVRVTLDLEVYEDQYLYDMDWKDLLELEGDETINVTIEDQDIDY